MSNLILVAPIDGWSTPLEEAPDPVFSGKMMGDGVAIDPTGATLRAPCDSEVVTVATGKHAVVLRAPDGAEILLHVGINTVELGGDGFQVHVSNGQHVRTGDPLITFDLDGIAQRVLSLVTPIVVVEGKGLEIVRRQEQRFLRAGEFLMELQPLDRPALEHGGGPEIEKRLRVPFEHGIHARPAALLSSALRPFSARVVATANGRNANARSAVAWMELGVRSGQEIRVTASGSDAAAALGALEAVLAAPLAPRRMPEEQRIEGSSYALSSVSSPGTRETSTESERVLRGVIASRGLAIGPALRIGGAAPEPPETGSGVARETNELERARGVVRAELVRLHEAARGLAREILEAHLSFIDDPELLHAASDAIARGKSAGWAWRQAVEQSVEALLAVGDPRVAERADDLREVAGRVLRALAGEEGSIDVPAGAILVGQELHLAQLVALPAGRVAGFCTAAGGPTSHVALLAASMNLPALVAAGPEVLRIAEGSTLVLDAEEGVLRIDPRESVLSAATQMLARRRAESETALAAARSDCRLASGERIEVFANVSAVGEAAHAVELGAEGCGVVRTEFLFFDRDTPPDAGQQTDAYQSIVTAFGGRPVVIRTLDAGSDKPLPYLPLPRGDNPALGVRGVRASLWRPELLRDQLRAILGVRPLQACRIMLPMISDVSEVVSVRQILEDLCREAGCASPQLGVMIETPAAALLADRLSAVADFLSIGTNDLAQYTLAMDRTAAELAPQLDALHPAVLRLIQITAAGGRAAGRDVAVCGGLASDPFAALVLVGLGVNELSAVASAVPAVKAMLRRVTMEDCRAVADRALAAQSPAEVRALARSAGGNR